MAERISVSAADLGEALTEFRLSVRGARGGIAAGAVHDPDHVAKVLHDTLSALAAHREPAERLASLSINRDVLLQVIGWANAHRPPGDWEPGFLSRFLAAADKAVADG